MTSCWTIGSCEKLTCRSPKVHPEQADVLCIAHLKIKSKAKITNAIIIVLALTVGHSILSIFQTNQQKETNSQLGSDIKIAGAFTSEAWGSQIIECPFRSLPAHCLSPCDSRWGLGTSSISITRELVRNTYQAPPRPAETEPEVYHDPPGA